MLVKRVVVPGYLDFPDHEIDESGRVWSVKRRRRALKAYRDKSGYLVIYLQRDGESKQYRFTVHKLVALVFLGPPAFPEAVVRHKDGSGRLGYGANNNVSNLEWGTQAENVQDSVLHGKVKRGSSHPRSRLTEDVVAQIKQAIVNREGFEDIAKRFNVSSGLVWSIARTGSWAHVPWPCDSKTLESLLPKKRKLLSKGEVGDIVQALRSGEGVPEIAKRFGVAKCTIYAIRRGRNWDFLTNGIELPRPKSEGERRWNTRLTNSLVAEIKEAICDPTKSRRDIIRQFGISRQVLDGLTANRTWKHVPWPSSDARGLVGGTRSMGSGE